jgi:hypothetical protein
MEKAFTAGLDGSYMNTQFFCMKDKIRFVVKYQEENIILEDFDIEDNRSDD